MEDTFAHRYKTLKRTIVQEIIGETLEEEIDFHMDILIESSRYEISPRRILHDSLQTLVKKQDLFYHPPRYVEESLFTGLLKCLCDLTVYFNILGYSISAIETKKLYQDLSSTGKKYGICIEPEENIPLSPREEGEDFYIKVEHAIPILGEQSIVVNNFIDIPIHMRPVGYEKNPPQGKSLLWYGVGYRDFIKRRIITPIPGMKFARERCSIIRYNGNTVLVKPLNLTKSEKYISNKTIVNWE